MAALEEIGIASYEFDISPEQLQSGIKRLDAMMGSWDGKGIRLGYMLSSSPETSNAEDNAGIPDWCNEAVITNLAIRMAPSYGKQVSLDTRILARESFSTILKQAAEPVEYQMPSGVPAGSGNRNFFGTDNRFLIPPVDNVKTGDEGELEII